MIYRSNKYKNKKVILEGIKFDSIKESKRYIELKLLHDARQIAHLELQPKFLLQPNFEHKYQGKQRDITYIADFSYYIPEDGDEFAQRVVEDVKSPATKTDVYRVKRKMFLSLFPDVDHREV